MNTAVGLINDYEDGSFGSQGTATRAEVAIVFMNFIKTCGDKVDSAADEEPAADREATSEEKAEAK